MKTKFIIGFFSLLGVLDQIQGQGWFLDSTYVWTESRCYGFHGNCSTTRYTFDNFPTMINGNIYYEKLVSQSSSGSDWGPTNFFYRTDDSGKVYLSYLGEEILVYDYSLMINDSFYISNGWGLYLVVDKIDSITLLNGEKRKQLGMRCSFDENPEHPWGYSYWIAGLGGLSGVYDIYIEECVADGSVPITLCLSRNDTLLFDNTNYDSCWFAPTATKDLLAEKISIYPNPASIGISIDSKNHPIQKVSVINLMGNDLFIGKEPEVDISLLPPGYYFLRIELENQRVVMKRFVKQ